MDLCTRDKTDELIRQLNADVDEFEQSGLRTLAIAIEDEGNGFKLIGLLPIRDPLRLDTKEAINRALQLSKIEFSFLAKNLEMRIYRFKS